MMPGTVTVMCKMPNGVILDLDRYERISSSEQNLQVRTISGGRTVELKGYAHRRGADPKVSPPPTLFGGYRSNEIDADFWAEWYERNKDTSALIKDKLIMGPPPKGSAIDQAKDHDAVPAQFSPLKGNEVPGVFKYDGAERAEAV